MDGLKVSFHKPEENVWVVRLQGEISAAEAPELSEALHGILRESPSKVYIELSSVKYISSAGIGTLVSFMKKLSKQGGSMCLVGLSAELHNLFKMTRLDKIFTFAEEIPAEEPESVS